MRIDHVHADMRDDIKAQGPLVDKSSGTRNRHNRGVAREYRAIKRREAEQRNPLRDLGALN